LKICKRWKIQQGDKGTKSQILFIKNGKFQTKTSPNPKFEDWQPHFGKEEDDWMLCEFHLCGLNFNSTFGLLA